MRIRLFQIDPQKDHLGRLFCSLSYFEKVQGCKGVDLSVYNNVLTCDIEAENLEDVFQILNLDDRPSAQTVRSMSCSDVVITKDGAFYCDSFGFKKVDVFYLAKQKCHCCGKEFVVRYNADGTYEYPENSGVCECESAYSPVEGELTLSEWNEMIDLHSVSPTTRKRDCDTTNRNVTVQITNEDLDALRTKFQINSKDDICAAIRECISFYVESHKESVSSLSGFVTTLCEFRAKDKCSEYCDGWPSEPVKEPDVPVNTTEPSTDPDAEWKKEYEERWQKAYE